MIRSFKCRKTERLFAGERVPEFAAFADQAAKRLRILNSAEQRNDLTALPSNRFEALAGDRAGQYSIRVNRQWRLCFRWGPDGPYDIEMVDYH